MHCAKLAKRENILIFALFFHDQTQERKDRVYYTVVVRMLTRGEHCACLHGGVWRITKGAELLDVHI